MTRAQLINFAAFIGARAFIALLSVFSRSRSATLVGSLANSHTSDIAVKIKLSAENRFSLQSELQHLDPSGAGKMSAAASVSEQQESKTLTEFRSKKKL